MGCRAAADASRDSDTYVGELLANNAASVNGKLRTLVVGVTDEQGEALINHRKASGTLFSAQRWIDGFKNPGQYITLTDVESGKSIRKPISVSPYHARSTAPGSDVSVVEVLLDTNSPNGGVGFASLPGPNEVGHRGPQGRDDQTTFFSLSSRVVLQRRRSPFHRERRH